MTTEKQAAPGTAAPKQWCCVVHKKIVLGITKVIDEAECGVSFTDLAQYNDFGYTSQSKPDMPVKLHLQIRFCPWCGTKREAKHASRTVEMIHDMSAMIVRPAGDSGEEERTG